MSKHAENFAKQGLIGELIADIMPTVIQVVTAVLPWSMGGVGITKEEGKAIVKSATRSVRKALQRFISKAVEDDDGKEAAERE